MEDKRKITVVVNGKFHAFEYAAELHRQGRLRMLISTMPGFVARRYGIDRSVYVGLPYFEVLKRGARRLFKRELPVMWHARMFTRTALSYIPSDSEVIVSFAGYSLEIFEAPRLKNALMILDRAATHTLANTRLRLQAAAYHGVNWTPHPKEFIDREMKEYALADRILVASGFVRQTFLDNGVPDRKIWKIPYGMSSHSFGGIIPGNGVSTPGNQKTPAKEPTAPVVLFVGQVSARKGVGVLVRAMEIVRAKRPDASLWIVGKEQRGFPEALLDKPWIRKWGVLRGRDLYNAFSRASVFSLLSFEEGLALVITEALQFGMPLVLTPNTGGAELAREPEDGYFVPIADPGAAAEKILLALEREHSPRDPFRHTWADFTGQLLTHLQTDFPAVAGRSSNSA